MATDDIYPDGDATPNDWGVNGDPSHFENLNEDKGSPVDTTYIYCDYVDGDDNELDEFTFETIEDIEDNSITQVVVWSYGWRIVGTKTPEVAISWDDGANFSAYFEVPWGDSAGGRAWKSVTFAGLSYSKADLDKFQVSYQADCPDKLTRQELCSVYVEVTYTSSTGWAHKFIGVAGASIGKISGLPIAKVGKVKGLAI